MILRKLTLVLQMELLYYWKNGGYAGASLKQRIWDFQKTSSKLDSLKIDEDIASLSLEDMKALMAYKIKSLYKLIVIQKEAIEVHKKI